MEIIRSLNWVDCLVIIIVFRISYVAFLEGLSHEIFPLAGGILNIIISLNYYNKMGALISQNLVKISPGIADFFSFLIITVVVGFVFKAIKAVLDKIIRVEWHPLIERFGGLVFGVARAFLAASLVLIVIALAPFPYLQRSIRERSVTGMQILRIGPAIYEKAWRLSPAARVKDASFSKEDLVRELIADKSLISRSPQRPKKAAEWEKI